MRESHGHFYTSKTCEKCGQVISTEDWNIIEFCDCYFPCPECGEMVREEEKECEICGETLGGG